MAALRREVDEKQAEVDGAVREKNLAYNEADEAEAGLRSFKAEAVAAASKKEAVVADLEAENDELTLQLQGLRDGHLQGAAQEVLAWLREHRLPDACQGVLQELGYVDLGMLKDAEKGEEEHMCEVLETDLADEFLLPTHKRFIHALDAARRSVDLQAEKEVQLAAELERVRVQQGQLTQSQLKLEESKSQPSSPGPRERVTPRRAKNRSPHSARARRTVGGGGSPYSEGTPSPGRSPGRR